MSRRRHSLTESIASALLAVALGILFTVALVHWIDLEGITTSSPAAQAGAALLAVPRAWLARWAALARKQLSLAADRRRLVWLEKDLSSMQEELAFLPSHIRMFEREAQALRVQIAVKEGELRPVVASGAGRKGAGA